jgi:hypothetical protein
MKSGLNIGLCSQTYLEPSGIVSGSEITTNGLAKAFLNLPEKPNVCRFTCSNYTTQVKGLLDLVIIEGWQWQLPECILWIRKHHPKVKIIFWNLSFWGFNGVVKLDVDGYLSNSIKNSQLLSKLKPTKFLMLAADDSEIYTDNVLMERPRNVVYLGMYHPSKSNEIEHIVLGASKEFDLEIYGTGWESHSSLSAYWKGVLPIQNVYSLYKSAKVVLGMTEERQARFGMINNRVFEALAAGACFISEPFAALQNTFGDIIFYSNNQEETKRHLQNILTHPDYFKAHRLAAMTFISRHHTYRHRVEEIMSFYSTFT